MDAIGKGLYLIFSRRGISATHPIIIKDSRSHLVVCSVASKDGDSKFDYSLVISKKFIPEKGTDEEIIEAFCHNNHLEEKEKGWKLAITKGIKLETIQWVVTNNLEDKA